MTAQTFRRKVKQLYPENFQNARERQGFACLATPDPTPPASNTDCWNMVVGSGLLDRLTLKSAGAEAEDKRTTRNKDKDTDKAKVKINGNSKTNTVENPPNLLVMKQVWDAGFSTPFPGGVPFGEFWKCSFRKGGCI